MKYTELRKIVQQKIKNKETFSARSIYKETEEETSYRRIDKNLLTMYNRGEIPGYKMKLIDIGNFNQVHYYYPDVTMLGSIKILLKGLFGG